MRNNGKETGRRTYGFVYCEENRGARAMLLRVRHIVVWPDMRLADDRTAFSLLQNLANDAIKQTGSTWWVFLINTVEMTIPELLRDFARCKLQSEEDKLWDWQIRARLDEASWVHYSGETYGRYRTRTRPKAASGPP